MAFTFFPFFTPSKKKSFAVKISDNASHDTKSTQLKSWQTWTNRRFVKGLFDILTQFYQVTQLKLVMRSTWKTTEKKRSGKGLFLSFLSVVFEWPSKFRFLCESKTLFFLFFFSVIVTNVFWIEKFKQICLTNN